MSEETTQPRKMYLVMITMDQPMEGTLNVAAHNKAHAEELALKMIEGRKNARIVDIVGHDELPGDADPTPSMSSPTTPLLN